MPPLLYIVWIASIGAFMFWIVHKHDRGRGAMVVKAVIVAIGVAAILPPLRSLIW
jgi:hypothetical protein